MIKFATRLAALLLGPITPSFAQDLHALLPSAGKSACYGRVYDRSHLAEHPDQIVTSMLLSLRDWTGTTDDGGEGMKATIGVTVRGQSKRLVTSTICGLEPGSNSVKCYLECDMGSFDLVASRQEGSITLELGSIGFAASCEGSAIFELTAGKDDRAFRLDPAERSACSDLEDQFKAEYP